MARTPARRLYIATTLTLEGEKKALLALRDQGEDVHWQMGCHYNNIVDHRLAEAAGYKGALAFFQKEIKFIPVSTLALYALVAKSFTEEIAIRYGVTKLGRLIALRNLTKAGPAPADPGEVEIRYPGKAGSMVIKTFAKCTLQDLNRAVQHAKGGDVLPPGEHLPDSDEAVVKRMMAALPKRYPDHHIVLRAFTLGPTTFFNLENVPLSICEDVFITLQNAIWWDDKAPSRGAARKPPSKKNRKKDF